MDPFLHEFQLDLAPAPAINGPGNDNNLDVDQLAAQRLAERYNDIIDLLRQRHAGAMPYDLPGDDDPREDDEMPEDRDLEAQQPWRTVNPMAFYRFSWEEIHHLIALLGFPPVFRTASRLCMSALEAFCLLTYRLSHTSRWLDIALLFPRSQSALSLLFREVLDFMFYSWKHLLLFDHVRLTPAYLRTMADTISEAAGPEGLDDCWGFIDGTHVRISRPSEDQNEMYSGQKKVHSIKYHAIATPDGLISHLAGPFSGKRHDSRMVTMSKIEYYLLHHSFDPDGRRMVIYGDEGYPRNIPILAPFRGMVTVEQNAANEAMRRPRLCVEWVFGILSNYWRFCHEAQNLRIGMSPIGKYYPVQAILLNLQICLGRSSSTTAFYGLQPPTVEEYLTPHDLWAETREVFDVPEYYESEDEEAEGFEQVNEGNNDEYDDEMIEQDLAGYEEDEQVDSDYYDEFFLEDIELGQEE